jgi:cytochrome c peroxidase
MTVAQALDRFDYTNLDAPAPAPDSEEKIELGRHLFFDARLSLHRDFSCSSCHHEELGWSDGLPRGRGAGGRELPRRTLSLLKVGYYGAFMWDGRAATIEDQVLIPLQSPAEMGMDLAELSRRLARVPEYRKRFAASFGDPAATPPRVAASLAAFVRRIGAAQDESAFERFRRDRSALSGAQQRGFVLFMGKAACVKCHNGLKLTYGAYLNTGIKGSADVGRFAVVALPGMRGAFRTPTLFNAALTPPYMHDGSLRTLRDVVEFYNRGGDDKSNVSQQIRPLSLTKEEIDDLTAFLGALVRPPRHFPVPAAFPDETAGAK